MKRATLFGSFSSMSPMADGSASDSRRASSDFGAAKRDQSFSRFAPPHFLQRTSPMRSRTITSAVVLRWQSRHSNS